MPQSPEKKCSTGKPSHRPCIQSMEIPPPCSKPPSRSTVCSSQCSRPQTPRSGSVASATSYKQLFCTSETCSNSENCIKTLPEFCPYGLKDDKDEGEFKCTGKCHSSNTEKDPLSKLYSINSNNTPLDKGQQNASKSTNGLCPAAVPLNTVKQSNSLLDMSSCCAVKAISPNQSIGSPMRSPPCSPTDFETQEKQSENNSPDRYPSDTNMTCCADAEETMQTRSLTDMTDAGTHPIPDTTTAGTCMPNAKGICGNDNPPRMSESKGVCGNEGPPCMSDARGNYGNEGPPPMADARGICGNEGPPRMSDARGVCGKEGQPRMSDARGICGKEGQPRMSDAKGICGNEGPPCMSDARGTYGNEGPPPMADARGICGNEGPPRMSDARGVCGKEGQPRMSDAKGTCGNEGSRRMSDARGIYGNEGLPRLPDAKGISGNNGLPPTSVPDETSRCCDAKTELDSTLTDSRKRSSIRTSFKLPETEPLIKSPPMPAKTGKTANSKKGDKNVKSCACPEARAAQPTCACPEVKGAQQTPKECSCHFPPAFNQFGCTGNIGGNCNCGNED